MRASSIFNDPVSIVAAARTPLRATANHFRDAVTWRATCVARHVTAHILALVNRRNLRMDKLEAAQRLRIELYQRLALPKRGYETMVLS
ncbi:hypothetical protein [Paraburkholderia sp. EG304]|uniref:hypothetical protein n=1 Tax=Paraburkholderia sp. EG304 TaxID=3237015 RepID=UPI00397816C2